jgi:hypothetical protein
MRPELYQRMLRDISPELGLAADLGRKSASFTGRHFQHRRFDVSDDPVLLDLYFAMQTERVPVGQLGIACRPRTRSVPPRCRRSSASEPRS